MVRQSPKSSKCTVCCNTATDLSEGLKLGESDGDKLGDSEGLRLGDNDGDSEGLHNGDGTRVMLR